MFDLLANLLSFFYDINNSYVIAIVLLTLVVLVISTPLTIKGTRSQLQMTLLQPELKSIQDKYGKDNREEMNKEMMEFYQENNINPIGGCLPLLFQIPVFLVLYRVILGLTRRATNVGFQLGSVVGSSGSGTEATQFEPDGLNQFNPAFVSRDSQLFTDLSSSNEMTSIGFDISRSASQVLGSGGLVEAIPYLVLVLVVGASGFVQHRMIRARQTGAVINPTQETVMKIIPFFLPIFSFTLPAAIVFYFLVSNLYRIAQQWYITRSLYSGEESLGAQVRRSREERAKDDKNSGNADGAKGSGNKNKNANSKNGSSKNGSAKSNNKGAKGSPKKQTGKNGSSKKSGSSTKVKAAAKSGSSPGRNSSGRSASARSQVEAKARKKKRK